MNLICCQLDIVWEDKAANQEKVLRMIERAQPERGSLVLLPEMFATGFSMNVQQISDSRTRQSQHFLADTARRFGIWIIAGIVTTAADGRGRNEAVVFSPAGEEIARYAKMHPYSVGGESKHYEAGREPVLFDWNGCRVAPFICYDLRFPEVFRMAIRQGAELLAVIANWPDVRAQHWPALLQARAIENQAYVAAVNRCGNDPYLRYPGRSMIINPRGEIFVDAGVDEGAIATQIDVEALRGWRAEFPVLADMRYA